MTNERRRFKRVVLRTRCWCEGKGSTLYVSIYDVSPGGFFIRTPTPFHTGDHVKVRWTFKKAVGEHEALMEVVWKRETEPLPGMGLKFIQVSSETVNVLKQIVEKDKGL